MQSKKIWLPKEDLNDGNAKDMPTWMEVHRASVLLDEEIQANPSCWERESQSPPGTTPDMLPNLKKSPLKHSMRNTK